MDLKSLDRQSITISEGIVDISQKLSRLEPYVEMDNETPMEEMERVFQRVNHCIIYNGN